MSRSAANLRASVIYYVYASMEPQRRRAERLGSAISWRAGGKGANEANGTTVAGRGRRCR